MSRIINFKLNIGWLYPDLMSTYGDRGNIIVLEKRCKWRNIRTEIVSIGVETTKNQLERCDIVMGGGAQDRQQGIVIDDLIKNKRSTLKKIFDNGIPGLFVCGSPQLMGRYYMTGDGKKLPGLGIFDLTTRHFGHDKPRCIGNTVGEISSEFRIQNSEFRKTIVGFENHGGRTYLGLSGKPFARVLFGHGNNGQDGLEGSVYKNVIGCYYHGPFLAKNPHIADFLIHKAIEIKYKQKLKLKRLDDVLEWQAHDYIVKRFLK